MTGGRSIMIMAVSRKVGQAMGIEGETRQKQHELSTKDRRSRKSTHNTPPPHPPPPPPTISTSSGTGTTTIQNRSTSNGRITRGEMLDDVRFWSLALVMTSSSLLADVEEAEASLMITSNSGSGRSSSKEVPKTYTEALRKAGKRALGGEPSW